MSTPLRASGGHRSPRAAERGGAASAVEELLKLLGKAARAHQLYLHNNPTYHRALELLRGAFAPVWAQLPELTLAVTEHELQWEGRAVYQELERGGDTIPWLLYKDGVRELRLLPGFEDEAERLLAVLRKLSRSQASEDDAITLLWDSDFAFLRYRFVEALEDESGEYRLGDAPGRLVDSTEPVVPAPQPGTVRPQEFDASPFFLAERELEYLRRALVHEYAHDLFADAVAMLIDTFETQPSRRVRDELCVAVEQLLLHALGAANYRGVAAILREVTVALGRASGVAPEHRERLGTLAAQLSTPEGLAQLVEALDVADVLPPDADLEALFGQLQPRALGPVLGWLDRARAARLRTVLRATADRLALANSAELVRLISSDDAVVAREAVRRAGALRSAAAVPALGELLGAGSDELRLTVAHALAEIGTTGALQALATALADGERDVRLVALRAIGSRGYRAALPGLEAIVTDRRMKVADLTEQMAVFEAYGSLCGEEGVAVLDGLLNGRSLLGRRQEPTLRACAAVALGKVRSDRALAALQKSADEKDVVVRNAVQRALRGL